ncbi:hypothetical protein A8O14_03620 [Polynucleobacter wuianus]|uniref:Uncharacterized protein n=1 Tax=Polynucleobacter wuianus TaxID=1743168 RepID=A0A191UEE3_9BURK|nr:hypothetical protein A8O14_03620 [Polynucleobacter wuianus]
MVKIKINKGIVFWGIAALIEITQMWKNRILEFAKRRGDKLLESARFLKILNALNCCSLQYYTKKQV